MRPSVLRSILGTALGGVLVGFVLAALVSTLVGSGPAAARRPESVAAHTYIVGLLERNIDLMSEVRPPRGIASRAQDLLTQTNVDWKPAALSYLGGGEAAGVGIYVYVAEVHSLDDQQTLLVPFTLTLAQGKVVRVQ